MKFSELFGVVFWHADMIGYQAVRRTIESIEEEYVDDQTEPVPVVRFEGDEKVLRLNRRNAATLQEAWGDDTAGCVGKEVLLTAEGHGAWAWVKMMPIQAAPRQPARRRAAKGRSK